MLASEDEARVWDERAVYHLRQSAEILDVVKSERAVRPGQFAVISKELGLIVEALLRHLSPYRSAIDRAISVIK